MIYTVFEGKDVGQKGLNGFVVKLSQNCAVIELEGLLEPMTNLKMNLGVVDGKLSAKDFYGKVIQAPEGNGQTHLVRFTSVPPEVDAYFQSHRQHADAPESS